MSKVHTISANVTKRVIPFSQVKAGETFRVLKSEYHRDAGFAHISAAPRSREVANSGTYVKIADSHAHDPLSGKDIILALHMPCRVFPMTFDVSHLPDWKVLNQGKPH